MTLVYPDFTALILRIGFGAFMLFGHGMGKLKMLLAGGEIGFPSVVGIPPSMSLGLAVFAEFVACIFIILGYKTRLAALPMIITMMVAAFIIHGSDPLFLQNANGGPSKEPALIYLIGFIAIYLLGSGKYSMDDKLDSVI